MKEKGVLGELQSFLRMKMVEKLRGTDLMPSENKLPTPRDTAMNLIVCDYLKHQKMHYTLSVFASECNAVEISGRLNSGNVRKQILDLLEMKSPYNNNSAAVDETDSVLDGFIKFCEVFSKKECENKSSQIGNAPVSANKLGLNAQSQTECVHITQGAQTTPIISSAKTQTKHRSCVALVGEADKQETTFEERNQFNPLLETTKTSNFELKNSGSSKGKLSSPHLSNSYKKHISEALVYLNELDGRLRYLDLKHKNLVHQKDEVNLTSEFSPVPRQALSMI